MRALPLCAATGLALLAATATAVHAEPTAAVQAAAPAAPAPRRHLVYAELLGKGGPWGLGWEVTLTPRLSLGAVASFALIREQRLYTAAPYLHVTALRGGRHALFGELGAVLSHSRVPSPVPEWEGASDSGVGGQAALGWEWSGPVNLRAYLSVVAGEGGVTPWGGLSLGVRL